MRSIWSGYLSFGTILVPVRSYAASGNLHISFHQFIRKIAEGFVTRRYLKRMVRNLNLKT